MMKKLLTIGIIILFIGVVVAPSINQNVVKASPDNDLIEVTTQACGIKGYDDTTVKLTRQQYQDLEQYLVEFRARLNQTTTREEAVPIFKEAVVELDKNGLLPKGMSVDQAQRLVTGQYQKLALRGNYFCLITGNTSRTACIGFPSRPLINVYNLIYKINNIFSNYYFYLFPFIEVFLTFAIVATFVLHIGTFLHLNLFNYIIFGESGKIQGRPYSYPSEGWVDSYGLFGRQQWSNSFLGDILPITLYGIMGTETSYNIGGVGFTGIALSNGYFVGTALHVDLAQA